MKGDPVAEGSRHDLREQWEARRLKVIGGDVPAVRGAFVLITIAFAQPQRRRKTGSGQFPDSQFRLFIGVYFDFSPMRRNSDEVGLLPVVIGNFKEPSAIGLSRL